MNCSFREEVIPFLCKSLQKKDQSQLETVQGCIFPFHMVEFLFCYLFLRYFIFHNPKYKSAFYHLHKFSFFFYISREVVSPYHLKTIKSMQLNTKLFIQLFRYIFSLYHIFMKNTNIFSL